MALPMTWSYLLPVVNIMNRNLSDQELLFDLETAICNVLRVSGPGINPNTRLMGDLGADSMDVCHLSCRLKDIVGAELDFRELFRQKHATLEGGPPDVTIQELLAYVRRQVSLQNPSTKVVIQ